MLLPEFLLDALPDDNASGIRIFCEGKEKQKEIADFFRETFKANWEKQEKVFEEEFDQLPDEIVCDIVEEPQYSKDNILLRVQPLDMQINDGARGYNEYGNDAFSDTVKALKEKYPGIRYEGCIQYAWCDEHCGDTVSYELTDDHLDEVYDFVGEILDNALDDEEMLEELDWMYEPNEHKDDLLRVANDYRKYLKDENYNKILEFVEEHD